MATYPEVLLDVAACATKELEAEGIPPERAADIGHRVAEALRKRWGGMDLYIPKAEELDLEPKYMLIYEQWKAEVPMAQMVRESGYSMQWICSIIRAARARRAQKVHAVPLFSE